MASTKTYIFTFFYRQYLVLLTTAPRNNNHEYCCFSAVYFHRFRRQLREWDLVPPMQEGSSPARDPKCSVPYNATVTCDNITIHYRRASYVAMPYLVRFPVCCQSCAFDIYIYIWYMIYLALDIIYKAIYTIYHIYYISPRD